MTTKAGPALTDLVTRARNGDQQAWDALVERYAPLVWSICRLHQLSGADAEDAGQAVWLHLTGHLDSIRELATVDTPARAGERDADQQMATR